MIFNFALIDIAASKVAGLAKSFANVFETELAFLTDNTKAIPSTSAGVIDVEAVEAVNSQAPVLSAFKMAEELNHSVVKYGNQVVDNALKVIVKNPKLMTLENSLVNAVDLVAANDAWEL